MKAHIKLYADEFDIDVWETYCKICGVDTSSTLIIINFDRDEVINE